jgi:excisionase family DNA binding protein
MTTKADLLSTVEAGAYLGVARHTLEVWRSTKRHRIPHLKLGGKVRYRRADLDAWLQSRVVDAEAA